MDAKPTKKVTYWIWVDVHVDDEEAERLAGKRFPHAERMVREGMANGDWGISKIVVWEE
jgi:hypothetical protein